MTASPAGWRRWPGRSSRCLAGTDQHQLAQAQHQLAQGQHQLADGRASGGTGGVRPSRTARCRLAPASGQLGDRPGDRGRTRPPGRLARRRQDAATDPDHHPHGPTDLLRQPARASGPRRPAGRAQGAGDTLDDLFGRLDAAFEAQRQFVANASHELRAPLTRQRALIQVALADPDANLTSLRAAHERVLASEQQLEQVIDALLTLTRGQAGLERREHLDLAARLPGPARARVRARRPRPRRSHDAGPGAGRRRSTTARASDRQPDRQRDPPQHPRRTFEITTGTRDGHAFMAIANTGPAVPPEQIQRLFQPFQRLDGARTGTTTATGWDSPSSKRSPTRTGPSSSPAPTRGRTHRRALIPAGDLGPGLLQPRVVGRLVPLNVHGPWRMHGGTGTGRRDHSGLWMLRQS